MPAAEGQAAIPTGSGLATVHGVVRNAATGEPLARALVRIEGDAENGALTDGSGRFEIPGVPVGQQTFEVIKPGFLENMFATTGAGNGVEQFLVAMATGGHNVLVAAEMPDLNFALAPTGSIQGQVVLSTGDPAQGIGIQLVRRTVQDGRGIWQAAGQTKTNSEGSYRFAGLAGGIYAIYTDPAMEGEGGTALVAGNRGAAARSGYASVFYPDAREESSAGRIRVRGGEQAQANLTLTLEPFYLVTALAALPQSSRLSAADRESTSYTALVMDSGGHTLGYPARFDAQTHTIQALLPDGTYSLLISTVPRMTRQRLQFRSMDGNPLEATVNLPDEDTGPMLGTVDFSVAGQPVANLRVPLSAPQPNAMQLNLLESETGTAAGSQGAKSPTGGWIDAGLTVVMVSLAGGWIDDGMVRAYASGRGAGSMQAVYTTPGSYWVHARAQKGFCEASFTAGGANLAREPLVIGISGSTAPMELTVRNDCSRLTVSLPESLSSLGPGEEPFYTVYVIPEFDSTADVEPMTLRASTGGSFTLDDLTPGNYRVYMFDAPVQLEYRNPSALAALPNVGQEVTLSPGVTGHVVLEAAGR